MRKTSSITSFGLGLILFLGMDYDAQALNQNLKNQTLKGEVNNSLVYKEETAVQETVSAMLALARAGNWDEYIKQFYAEINKISTQQQHEQLVQRYENEWGVILLAVLEEAVNLEPSFENEGKLAIFRISVSTLRQNNLDQPDVIEFIEKHFSDDEEVFYFTLDQVAENVWKYRL